MQDIKHDFPIFTRQKDLVYLDSAATSLTPRLVIDKLCDYYTTYNANIARGLYKISTQATEDYELSRHIVAQFLHANDDEVVFTSGTTMSLNMIAYGLAHTITDQDNIITTAMEHHANFIPWQQLCNRSHAQFRVARVTSEGYLDKDHLMTLVDAHTKILALSHVSNVLGTINPILEIIAAVREKNPRVTIIVDAAQSIAHMPIDVSLMDCDFLAFSMHKAFGPTGVGILYGKRKQLEKLKPLFTGGEMIESVTTCETIFRELPHRLEAGTPDIAGVIASTAAIDYIKHIGFDMIHAHENEMLTYCMQQFRENFDENICVIGSQNVTERSGLISFTFKNFHPHDIATILDHEVDVAVRAGQHCAMPLHMEHLQIPATIRASFSIYNTKEDVDRLITGLHIVQRTLSQ